MKACFRVYLFIYLNIIIIFWGNGGGSGNLKHTHASKNKQNIHHVHAAQSASRKADGTTSSPVAVKPCGSTPPSVPVRFPLGWRTSSYSSSCSSRIGFVSPHPIRCFSPPPPPTPPLIPSQELKPPSEAAKRPPGLLEEGGQRSPPSSDSASITERPPLWSPAASHVTFYRVKHCGISQSPLQVHAVHAWSKIHCR